MKKNTRKVDKIIKKLFETLRKFQENYNKILLNSLKKLRKLDKTLDKIFFKFKEISNFKQNIRSFEK